MGKNVQIHGMQILYQVLTQLSKICDGLVT